MKQPSPFKPYDFVNVNLRESLGYAFTGEVMSFVIPQSIFTRTRNRGSATVMVRRVPGHPGTLDEFNVDLLEKVEKKKFVHYAKVSSRMPTRRTGELHSGSFPADMLRYDHAAPVNFELGQGEVAGLARVVATGLPGFEEFTISSGLVIATATVTRLGNPFCTARWDSFLWKCEFMKSERLGDSQ